MRLIKYTFIVILTIVLGILISYDNKPFSPSEKNIANESLAEQQLIQTFITFNEPYIKVRPQVSYPGDTVLVQTSHEGIIEFNGNKYNLQRYDDLTYITFLPISIDQTPGKLQLLWHPKGEYDQTTNLSSDNTISAEILINEKLFSTQYLEVTKEQEEMYRDSERIAEDRRKVNAALSNPIQRPLFSGEFLKPLEGRVSTEYGYTRYVNGTLSSRHNAIDIAAPEGTPIIAPNNGKVVLAESLYLSGNRVIIDHGSNLISSFSHLSKLNVEVGDEVTKGEIIGWVGSTGFSTGPHLHHAIYVHDRAVNPELFFNNNPFEWE